MYMHTGFDLLPPKKYIKDLIKKIDSSQRRVLMIALVIVDDSSTQDLIAALERASRRGVQVSIGLDIYFTYRTIEDSTSKFDIIRRQLGNMRAMRKRLVASGAEVRWLGMFGMTLFSRRTHIKWTVVDDYVYSFGGVNLYSKGIHNNDFMLRAHDRRLGEHISAEHHRVIATDRAGVGYKSYAADINGNFVLVDGGKSGDSIIYRHALQLAQRATKVVFVSQYCPTGRLGRTLKHHPNAELYFNPWRNAEGLNRTLIRISTFMHRMKNRYERSDYLHAKLMLFEMPNGEEIALTGSHNFVGAGGLLGTREVALETSDKAVIRELKRFVKKHVI